MDFGKAPAQGTIALILFTAIVSLLVGVFGKKIADGLLELLLKPIKYLFNSIYRWIAPRNPFSISVRNYRSHVLRSNLTRMENPVGPNLDIPLEHAFAPIKLRTSTTQEYIDLFSYAASTQRSMILGGPGTGKTTLMKCLITSTLKKCCHPDLNDLVPVFIVLRNLAKKQHTVEQAIVSVLADYHFPNSDEFVKAALNSGKMIIILDGLDEVGANREFVVEQIQDFCNYDDQREVQNRLFVTCREHSYKTKDLQGCVPAIVTVEPFANRHMRVFLEGWPAYKGRSAIRLYGLIQSDPQIRDICRNPLLLTILTGLYLDTEDFQIPSSRDRFYKDAVDELLIRRPARRQIKQIFNPEDKRQILERVALERLETVEKNQDPEELTFDELRNKAVEVLRQDKFDIHELIKELVEINGIIKPSSEISYTCAHRTIQEYFAAREAMRRRETLQVVEHFGDRIDLIQVLYFYCGLNENIPALTSIVKSLISDCRWLEAGRALFNMKEAPDSDMIEIVASKLRDNIAAGAEIEASFEVLSSMANRTDSGFEPARLIFADAIDTQVAHDPTGASALETAIATSPEIALKLIPGLLKHNSDQWKAVGVQLLRDIDTDESLDMLVQLLVDKDIFIRSKSAQMVVGLMKTRNRALRDRKTLLPERKDKALWPLEQYFPGAIAIPTAEALVHHGESENQAINCAISAVKSKKDSSSDKLTKKWHRVPLDYKLLNLRKVAALAIFAIGIMIPLFLGLVTISLNSASYIMNKAIVLNISKPYAKTIDAIYFENISDRASNISKDILTKYPNKTTGVKRLLPSNWIVKPDLPSSKIDAYDELIKFKFYHNNLFESKHNIDKILLLKELASEKDIINLHADIISLNANIRPNNCNISNAYYTKRNWLNLISIVIPLFVIFILISFIKIVVAIKKYFLSADSFSAFIYNIRHKYSRDVFKFMYLLFISLQFQRYSYYLFTLSLGIIASSLIIKWFPWPNNPLISTIDEVIDKSNRE